MGSDTTTLILLIVLGFTTWQGLNTPGVMENYLFSTDAIRLRRQWIRLVSPCFLHADWRHFAGNAITLFFFARPMEMAFGPGAMLSVFFGSAAGGHLLCLWLNRTSDYRALGASGGALGIMFAMILFQPTLRVFIIPGWLYAVGYLFYTLSSLRGGGGISHEAHLGGMLTGVVLAFLMPSPVPPNLWLGIVLFMMAGAGLWYVHVNPARVPGFFRMQVQGWRGRKQHQAQVKEANQVDDLLDKVSKKGIQSLSNRERKILEQASKKRSGRA